MNFYKAIFLFLCKLIVLSSNAQSAAEKISTDSADFQADMLHVFEHMDMSELTTDFFYDKAFPFTKICSETKTKFVEAKQSNVNQILSFINISHFASFRVRKPYLWTI